jgi:hypothetical protein
MGNPSISRTAVTANLVQGVSQQAAQQRRDAQCEEQFDCINSVLEGCVARPHGQFIKRYPGEDWSQAFFNETFHGDENYLTGIKADGSPFAIDLIDGTVCTMTSTAPNNNYQNIGVLAKKDRLRAQVVDDFTFITNREAVAAMTGTTSAAKVNEALVFVRATAFGTTYSVTVSGPGGTQTGSYTTSATVVAPTATIADAIQSQIHGVTGYTVNRSGSTLWITRADGQDFTVSTSDGNGDDYMRAYDGEVSAIEKLPARAFDGIIMKVVGDKKSGADGDFWVKFVGSPSTGNWQETVAPSTKTTLDAATMPHVLVCTAYRTFQFRRPTWSTRVVGDGVKNAKDPSFIGKTIRDLTYYNRRLGCMWAGGTVFSKTDNAFTFFPDTVQTVLATAPVDTKVAGGSRKGPPILDFVLQANETLYLWSQKEQFRIDSGNEPFKEDTVEEKASMAYEYSPLAKPIPVGSMLFMSTDVGQFATLKAIQFASQKLAGDTDVLAHAPKYIKGGVRILTSNDALRTIFVQTDGDKQSLFLFNWTYSSDQGFIQSAINKWRIPGGDILWCSQNGNLLRVLQQRPEGPVLMSFNLSPQAVDDVTGALYLTRLDLRVTQAQVTGLAYNSTTKQTSFTLPYTPTGPDLRVVLADDNALYTRGREYNVVSVVGAVVTVSGDLTGSSFYAGQRITAERLESEFFIRSDNGAEPIDEITINRFKVNMAATAYTRIEVTNRGETVTQSFEGRVLGSPSAVTGTPAPQNVDLDIGVESKSTDVKIRLVNDHFLPSAWQNVAYDFDAVGWKGAK